MHFNNTSILKTVYFESIFRFISADISCYSIERKESFALESVGLEDRIMRINTENYDSLYYVLQIKFSFINL
jgi:hypothetical protein